MRRRGQLYGLLAAVAWSLGGVLQRDARLDAATLTAGRAAFAAATLLVWLLAARRRRSREPSPVRFGLPGALLTVSLAIASSLFILALHYTTVAHVLLFQAISPVIAAALAWIVLGERVRPQTWLAMVLALAGVAVMVSGGAHGSLRGDLFAILNGSAFAVSIVVIRRHRTISMVPAVACSQVLVMVVVGPLAHWGDVGAHALLALAAFGVVQMAGGLALFTLAAALIPAAELSLLLLLEVLLGPLWVWLAFAERPGAATLIGGCALMAAVVLQTRGARPAAA